MRTRITGIDHPIIGVRDLAAAGRAYERLGFVLSSYGIHPEWGTANYCIMFDKSYIELLGVEGQGTLAEMLRRFLIRREGLFRVSLGSEDAEGSYKALAAAGLDVEPVEELSRRLDDTVLRFRLVRLPEGATPGVPSFVNQHLTPDAMRRPEWLSHPNGAKGIASVTAVVDEPAAEIPAYDKVFGPGAATVTDATVAIHTGNGVIFLTSPDELTQLHPDGTLDPAPASPSLVALTVIVDDPDATAAFLASQGVRFSRDIERRVRVPPGEACGVLLEFAARRQGPGAG